MGRKRIGPRISIRVPDSMLDVINAYVKKENRPRAEVIREVISLGLQSYVKIKPLG